MIWLVVITIIGGPDGIMVTPVALAGTEPICQIIGASFVEKLRREIPQATVGFVCKRQVAA